MEEQDCCADIDNPSARPSLAKQGTADAKARRRIDPRVSLVAVIALNVVAFASPVRWVVPVAVAMDALLLLWCGRTRMALYWLIGYGAMCAICYGCIAAGPAFAPFGASFLYMSKIFPAAMFASAMIATTHTGELACGLQSFGLPSRVTVATCVALRFFPTIAREARSVREAMSLRSKRLSLPSALRHPGLVFESFIVPFVHRISIVADELGDALTCRGADTVRRRTSYYDMGIGAPEVIVLAALAVLVGIVVMGRLG